MSRNRFEAIRMNLHLADNSELEINPEKKKDKLFKSRLFMENLREMFRKFP